MTDRGRTALALAGFALAGLALVVSPAILHGRMPGNLGDARFNAYILEHFTQWLTGRVPNFWQGDFFYPFPLTIAFSDNHLGNGIVFAALRGVGFDSEDAFRGWFAFGFVLDFAACATVLTRLGYGWPAAGAGAFLFAFGLPMTAQEGHAQLVYRFGVPLAVFALISFEARGRLESLVSILFWTVWQFTCSIYLGYFLCLLLLALVVSLAICGAASGRATLTYWPSRLLRAWQGSSTLKRLLCLLALLTLLGLLMLLFRPYFQVSRLYGFARDPSIIESMLPRPASYLLTVNSRLWQFSWVGFDALPMRPEHAMFMGVAPILAIAAFLILKSRDRAGADGNFAPMLLAILLLVILTLFVENHSLYEFLVAAPGANAIRAVARIATVFLFPVAVLTAAGIGALLHGPAVSRASRGIAVFIILLMVVECAAVDHVTSSKQEWRARLGALEARLPRPLPRAPILMVASSPGEPAYQTEIDAMLLAQTHGWQTFNGYSGNQPHGHSFSRSCQDAARNIEIGLEFDRHASDTAFEQMARRTVRVGYEDCDTVSLMRRPHLSRLAGPLPASVMASAVIGVDRVELAHGMVHLGLSLQNTGAADIPAISTTDTPVRLSARYVPLDMASSDPRLRVGAGWELRQDLVIDVVPGERQHVDLAMPPPDAAGRYRIAVSLVQDGVAWFHDRGMPIAISHAVVTRDKGVEIRE